MIPVERLEVFLATLRNDYVVLKNPDLWSNLEVGGDWDLLVRDLPTAREALWNEVGLPDRWIPRSYVDSSYFAWGHIDLLPSISWRGLTLADTSVVLSTAGERAGIRVASEDSQIVAACIHPLIAYGAFKPRYLQLLKSRSMVTRAAATFGAQAGPRAAAIVERALAQGRPALSRAELSRLRATAVVGGFKRRSLTVGDFARFVAFELAERQRGPRVHLGVRREADIRLIIRYHAQAGRSVAVVNGADLRVGRGLRSIFSARAAGRSLVLRSR